MAKTENRNGVRSCILTFKKQDLTPNPSGCIDIVRTLRLYDRDKNKARKFYLENIDLKIEDDFLQKEIEEKPIIGSWEFVEKIKDYFNKKSKEIEIPKHERYAHRPDPQKLFKDVKDKNDRNKRIKKAYPDYGYTLPEIGRGAGLHYVSVSRIVNGGKKML